MANKTLELRTFKGCTECVEVGDTTRFKSVVIFSVNEEPARAFLLVSFDRETAIYQEAEALRIGN